MKRTRNYVNIVLICDNSYVLPTAVAVTSLIENKKDESLYRIAIVTTSLPPLKKDIFNRFASSTVTIDILETSLNGMDDLHVFDEKSHCVATPAALLKFCLPELFPDMGKVLYLDGDIIVRDDLTALFETDLSGSLLAAVVDSGSIYYKHKYVSMVNDYFNSGVMLLDLEGMRENDITSRLVEEKRRSQDFSLMDQNIFNIVFDRHVKLLPIEYNLLYVNLKRAIGKYNISDINKRYNCNYRNLGELCENAKVIHYSSKDKPWKALNVPLGEEWYKYYCIMHDTYSISKLECTSGNCTIINNETCGNPSVKVSIIMPIFNLEKYLAESIECILSQSFTDLELICVDDGSTDSSSAIIKKYMKIDSRVRLVEQENQGQSAARNHAFEISTGEYIYFFDGDDILKAHAIETLLNCAETHKVDVVQFDGTSFYETKELENLFPVYKSYYRRSRAYGGVHSGSELYSMQVENNDFKVSPCLVFIKKDYMLKNGLAFREGIIHEDNIFALELFLFDSRVFHLKQALFCRRVRENSTMTKEQDYKRFLGYYTCVVHIMCLMMQGSISSRMLVTVEGQWKRYLATTKQIYGELEEDCKAEPAFLDVQERFASSLIFQAIQERELNSEWRLQGNQYQEELILVRASLSFRIGRFITFIPRKIRGGIRCYQENGTSYTLRRVKEKLSALMGR